jgi:PhnB protein
MSAPYKPAGYSSVSPYLIVDGAEGTVAFLTRTFGARELRRLADPEGGIRHVEVQLDDSTLMLADGGPGHPPVPSHVHVYVPDVDAAYRRALEAGAESVQAPAQKDDPDRRGGVRDPGGTTWWIGTQVG